MNIDELFNETQDVRTASEKIDNTEQAVADWLANSPKSFNRCYANYVADVRGQSYRVEIEYDMTLPCVKQNGFSVNPDTLPADTLPLCTASVRSLGYVIDDIRPSEGTNEVKGLMLYGHTEDYDNEFGSRIDSELMKTFSQSFPRRYDKVYLSGAFDTVEDMKNVILFAYENLTTKKFIAKVVISLDSMVHDDDGGVRTVGDMIHAGYVPSSVVPNPMVVEYRYRRLDPMLTAWLYTKKLKVRKKQQKLEI